MTSRKTLSSSRRRLLQLASLPLLRSPCSSCKQSRFGDLCGDQLGVRAEQVSKDAFNREEIGGPCRVRTYDQWTKGRVLLVSK